MVNSLKLRYKYTSAIENQRNNIWTIIRQSNKLSCQSVNYLPVVLNIAKEIIPRHHRPHHLSPQQEGQ